MAGLVPATHFSSSSDADFLLYHRFKSPVERAAPWVAGTKPGHDTQGTLKGPPLALSAKALPCSRGVCLPKSSAMQLIEYIPWPFVVSRDLSDFCFTPNRSRSPYPFVIPAKAGTHDRPRVVANVNIRLSPLRFSSVRCRRDGHSFTLPWVTAFAGMTR